MSNRFVAAALDFFGFGDGLDGEGLEFDDEFEGFGPDRGGDDPTGVYPLRSDRAEFSGMAIIRAKPQTIEEAPQVAEQIKSHLPVIVNLEDVPEAEARRIVDFLGGVIYGLNGSMKKVARSVFICSPFDVPVEQLSISTSRVRGPHEDEETADVRSRPF
ncbi:MAG: cell division protein SepF [Armatimonadota bacterium]